MNSISHYVLTVLCAAIITAIIIRISEKNQTTGNIIKMICVVFMTLSVITPLLKIKYGDASSYIDSYRSDADRIVSEARNETANALMSVIKEKTQSYIVNKAAANGADIIATVDITEPDTLTPDIITIEGEVSPYVKEIIKKAISEELGIPEEKQIWK